MLVFQQPDSLKPVSKAWLTFLLMLAPLLCHSQDMSPVILYTDIDSGPVVGGENNIGVYLSIFGTGFGADIRNIRVLINGVEVAAYKYLGPSNGRTDVQQLSVQPGPRVTSGSIAVIVDGKHSNNDHSFFARDGRIYFVSLDGSDHNGQPNDINKPFRHVQSTFDRKDFLPGDTIVVRGGRWKDLGRYSAFLTFYRKTGSMRTPLTIMGYPGETILIDAQGKRGGITFYETQGGAVISGFDINGNGKDLVQLQSQTHNVRIVNNELYGLWKEQEGSGAVTGNGMFWRILGNHIHHNGVTKLMHGIYIDNTGGVGSDSIEIAYNHIHDQTGGRGIQLYDKQPSITNVRIHDNVIHDIDRDGIVVGNNASIGIEIYDNIIYRTGRVIGSGIRFDSPYATAEVYRNLIYDADMAKKQGAIYIERAKSIALYKNVIQGQPGQEYIKSDVSTPSIIVSGNLWYGSGKPPHMDLNPVHQYPGFRDPENGDFQLTPGSWAGKLLTDK
jgi:hypothetical protein